MLLKFQTKLVNELETQIQEANSLGVEVDERAITRQVFSERRGHVRGIGWKVKGVGSSSSTVASYRPHLDQDIFAAKVAASEARHLVTSLQSQLPNIQLPDDHFVPP